MGPDRRLSTYVQLPAVLALTGLASFAPPPTMSNSAELKYERAHGTSSEFDLEKTLNSGMVVVVEHFATWCPSCPSYTQELSALHVRLNEKPVLFLTVTVEGSDILNPWIVRNQASSALPRNIILSGAEGELMEHLSSPGRGLPWVVVLNKGSNGAVNMLLDQARPSPELLERVINNALASAKTVGSFRYPSTPNLTEDSYPPLTPNEKRELADQDEVLSEIRTILSRGKQDGNLDGLDVAIVRRSGTGNISQIFREIDNLANNSVTPDDFRRAVMHHLVRVLKVSGEPDTISGLVDSVFRIVWNRSRRDIFPVEFTDLPLSKMLQELQVVSPWLSLKIKQSAHLLEHGSRIMRDESDSLFAKAFYQVAALNSAETSPAEKLRSAYGPYFTFADRAEKLQKLAPQDFEPALLKFLADIREMAATDWINSGLIFSCLVATPLKFEVSPFDGHSLSAASVSAVAETGALLYCLHGGVDPSFDEAMLRLYEVVPAEGLATQELREKFLNRLLHNRDKFSNLMPGPETAVLQMFNGK